MISYIKIGSKKIATLYHKGYKEKATITLPTNEEQDLSFDEIIELFRNNDLNKILFYGKKNNSDELELEDELNGYPILCGYTNNIDVGIATINLKIKTENQMSTIDINNEISKKIDEKINMLMSNGLTDALLLSLTDSQAIKFVDLFPKYVLDKSYIINDRFVYDGKLYKVLKDHISKCKNPSIEKDLYINLNDNKE